MGVEVIGAIGGREPPSVAGELPDSIDVALGERAVVYGVDVETLFGDDVDTLMVATARTACAIRVHEAAQTLYRKLSEDDGWPCDCCGRLVRLLGCRWGRWTRGACVDRRSDTGDHRKA